MVDEETAKVVLVTDELVILVEALVELVEVSLSSSVALEVAVAEAEAETEAEAEAVGSTELELPPSPATIWKGKPYWKTLASDSRVIMMP